MRTELLSLAGLILLGASLGGCAVCTCDPPTDPPLTIEAGAYAAAGPTQASALFPHGDQDKMMQVDRAAGMVEIHYLVDGQEVVERWRMTDE